MPPRILIAEDDELQAGVLQSALESRGYEAEIVPDGLQAVRRLRTGRYDLALLDYHLPEVDGLAAARLLHDFFAEGERPGLIAVTALAEGLSEREGISGTCFDAVVSKRLGLSVLLTAVDANLTCAAKRHAGAVVAAGRAALRDEAAKRRRRLLAPLAALPALAMVAAFMAGFAWGMASLSHVDAALGAAHRTAALTTNSTAVLGAVQDAETSQRTYLATRAQADRALFEGDMQRVDRLLGSPAPLVADGSPGVGAVPQTVIVPRLRALAEEARVAQVIDNGAVPVVPALSAEQGRDTIEQLRDWAAALVSGSQLAVLTGLDAVRHNVLPVLGVLAIGIVFGLWSAAQSVKRRWRELNPAPRPEPIPTGMRINPVAQPRTAWSSLPLLDVQAD
jgi:CheY-like chemotaxis protein/CHASE3 domain sensor protein